ncbi:MAG TPA: CBS domain-containing protein [Lacipirellulaceae bacterium]|nr:CBS domain-containing protein [Lacipirellulaceae bacterium]
MSVGRICVREVDTAEPGESVAVVAQRMHQRAVGTLVVVNDVSQVVGIVTDRDLVSRVLAKNLSPAETEVREVMTIAPKTVFEETSIESALLIMRSGRFRRIPVVDRKDRLLGLVTLDDVLMLLAEEFTQIGRLLNRETPQAVIEDQNSSGLARLENDARLGVGD